ncbi:hypothetical protein ACYOEI_17840, partial [Singulisphaera rosea]
MHERFEVVINDRVRNSSLRFAIPPECGHVQTLGDVLSFYRSSELEAFASGEQVDPGPLLELSRYADSLFLLDDEGTLGELFPDLRFRVGGRACGLDHRLGGESVPGPIRIEVDRSRTGYRRNWPAYLSRRWSLRADAYERFVESLTEQAYGSEAGDVLQLDTPDRARRFIAAVARRIHAAPYETYSRYLDPCVPFRSCDQALDRIIEGDGGHCAEKAMALYLIAHAYGI